MRTSAVVLAAVLGAVSLWSAGAGAQNAPVSGTLRAGAARVDVTPAQLPRNYLGVLDRLHARAIVLENGTSRAALITVDAGSIPDATWQAVTQRLQAELGIPPAQVRAAGILESPPEHLIDVVGQFGEVAQPKPR